MEEQVKWLQELIKAAKDAEDGEQLCGDDALREAAGEHFSSYEEALAAALVEATQGGSSSRRKPPAVARVKRETNEAFEYPFYVETGDGKLFSFHGPELVVSEDAQILDAAGLVGALRAIHYVGDSEGIFLFSDEGRYFGVDRRLITSWDRREERRTIRDTLFLSGDESIRAMIARRDLGSGRLVHITRGAKGKATDVSDLSTALDRSGREAFKLRDGDVPVAVLGAARDTTIFCASALGRGIHFESQELRSMGAAAVGVNVMKLAGDDDEVVAAFEGRHVKQLAVITAEGLGKRVDFSEFRTQGRAGQGMQLARVNPGDRIAGVVPCNPAEDVAILSDEGRVWRLPAGEIHFMGRPAKGNRVVELADGERIIHLAALPCGG